MKLTVVQLSPQSSPEENLRQMTSSVEESVRQDGSDLVVLPEMWSCLGGDRRAKFDAAEELPGLGGNGEPGSIHAMLSALARNLGIVLHAGSIGERRGDRLSNVSLVFDASGVEVARYRKIHLFDVETEQGHVYRESDTFIAGSTIATFEAGGLKVGCAICYDLRFPALFAALRERGCDLIVLPAAFTAETGAAHWETLLRARAIETQCWIAAAGTTGVHYNETGAARSTYGHSLICDPWGIVVAQAGGGIGRATAHVDRGTAEQIRERMPVWQHRTTIAP